MLTRWRSHLYEAAASSTRGGGLLNIRQRPHQDTQKTQQSIICCCNLVVYLGVSKKRGKQELGAKQKTASYRVQVVEVNN